MRSEPGSVGKMCGAREWSRFVFLAPPARRPGAAPAASPALGAERFVVRVMDINNARENNKIKIVFNRTRDCEFV